MRYKHNFILVLTLIRISIAIHSKNGRYEDVYIIVQDNTEENEILLDRIKEVFTDASKLLFRATQFHLYFGNIKIVLPKSWTSKPEYKQVAVPALSKQYITVGNYGTRNAHVRGLGHCGGKARYLYLNSDEFLLKDGYTWGNDDKVILHEWGHFRWGLFDEYSLGMKYKSPRFYQEDGKWKPVRCTDNVQGAIGVGKNCRYPDHIDCDHEDARKMMDDTCKFCPYSNQNVEASLMSHQWTNGPSMFCDEDIPTVKEEQRHNKLAPNLQNIVCNYRSAWAVMRQHEDFHNTTALPRMTNITPEFEVMQATKAYRVFVFDVSGSMKGSRLDTLRQTGEYVIQNFIPEGSWLGVVTFNDTGKTVKDLTEIKSQADRDEVKAALPTYAEGGTCIGCGIKEGIEVLKRNRGSAYNGEIILISDGQNTHGNISSSREAAISENVIVHTVAFTKFADTMLSEISRETGGRRYVYLENGKISFVAVLAETITGDITQEAWNSAMLVSEKIDSISSYVLSFGFSLEDGLGKNTSITAFTRSASNIQLYISGPNNDTYTLNTTGQSATLLIPDIAEAGDYTVTVTVEKKEETVEYFVQSTPTNNDTIRTFSTLSTSNFNFTTSELPIIFTDVMKGYSPILNATVTARIETDDVDSSCDILLLDDGNDPDALKNDGLYSGYIFPRCLRDGRVNVIVNVQGQRDETMILKGIARLSTLNEGENDPEIYNYSFQRVEVLEYLYVTNYVDPGENDTLAPGRITDLFIYHIVSETTSSGEGRNVTVTWTATGDDRNVGKASDYIIRFSDDFDTLFDNFDSADRLIMENATLVPKESGATEALKIVIDAEGAYTQTAFIAIKAVDESGNAGEMSNIMSIVVANGYRMSGEQGFLQTVSDDDFMAEKDNTIVIYIILGGSAAVAVLLLVGMMASCFFRLRRFEATQKDNESILTDA